MATPSDLEANLVAIAERSAQIKAACANEESTKHFLILPVIGALGYDYTNPFVVQPEYAADFRSADQERVDYAVMIDGTPAIAIECKKVGTDLAENRGQLRTYFSALQSVHVGILTDGIRFEFFTDSEEPNIMDAEPFITLDLEVAARSAIPSDVLEALSLLVYTNFHPEYISEAAEMRLVAKRLRSVLMQEIRDPSDEFCSHILRRVGLKHLRRSSIRTRYGGLIRRAFEEAIVFPVLEALRTSRLAGSHSTSHNDEATTATTQRIVTTDRELAVYRYVCRRLAYLAADEHQFSSIERVEYRDYVGKFAVYYENVRKGRLFDFIEGSDGYDKFIFPEPFGEIVTNAMRDIDDPLRAVFTQRVRELGAPKLSDAKLLQSA